MFNLKKKRLRYLRNIWGKSLEKYRDFNLISSYHNLLNSDADESIVDEKTWNDLDFNSIFTKMDRNVSSIGQQYLYHLLHKYEKDENVLKKKFGLISYLKGNRELREKIQLNLFGLSGVSSYFIAYLVLVKNLPHTKYYPLFILCSISTVVSLLLITVNGFFLFAALAFLLTNIILNKIFSKRIYEFFTGFSGLNSMLISAMRIGKIQSEYQIKELELLNEKRDLLKSLKNKLGYLVIDKESTNDLVLIAIEYFNMFLLFDIIAYYRSVNILLKYQDEVREVFESVAGLDASISVASYLAENNIYSNPSFNDTGEINFQNLYHPLIQDAVPNSAENLLKSVLITGSNMSGKTTFIKTLGINFILSQTLYISFSKNICIPKLRVKSAIRRNEDLEEGKSYFFVEIETLLDFIRFSEEKGKYMFLIDEIFRGTNTIERLASSTSVLKYLDMNNKVFVTTHDIELQDMLENNFAIYHFSEQVEGDNFFFNYKIEEGPCSSGNAIKLLEIMKYPASITNEANQIAKELLLNSSLVKRVKT